jgi:hypothetical protein
MSRHQMLDEYDDHGDRPWWIPRIRPFQDALPMPLGKYGGCWCGNPTPYHDWPGKADGAPHPRSAENADRGTPREQKDPDE